ncbi:MAG: protein-disulfide reductase DsbD family protein [Alistipes sp.]
MQITKSIKFLLFGLLLSLFVTTVKAQENIVRWTNSVEQTGEGTYRLLLQATIIDGWHMYDLGPYSDAGPTATVINFTPTAGVTLVGKVTQLDKPYRYVDDFFGMEIGYFEHKARFAQKVKLSGEGATVKATVEWMACNEGSCMPPDDKEFTFKIGTGVATPAATATEAPTTETVDSTATITPDSTGMTEAAVTAVQPAVQEQKDVAGNHSFWGLIIEAILWGFAMLLTPCVFPMVPMTVSFFMKSSTNVVRGRFNAFMYGLFIILLYTLPIAALILITRVVGGDTVTADIFNWLATHWLPNLIFFAVFMIFAASFFGAFEITLPSWIVNKSDSKADSKSLGGIFFLALTLVLVSFSCTGPIVGSVLIKSTSGGDFWVPIITMLAFSVAFALPFMLFAFFPSMLKNLPKSGGWLNSVKVVLGFIEVALGMKFLSVADQTYHWGLLDREIYLGVWIVVFTLLGLYLLGKIKFAHDSDMPYLGVGRLLLSIITLSFVVYLIPGMWGAPLKGLSGYLPPLTTQDFVLSADGGGGSVASKEMQLTVDGNKPKYSDFLHLPDNLQGFFDLKEAEAYAAQVNKPLFIDFTGHGCVNCREMESRVWSDPQVLKILREDYVIVALYADDKTELAETDWITTESGKVLKGLGKINSHYALTTYGVNAQPYYILQGRDGKILVDPRGYDLDVQHFITYLNSGIEAYKAQ